MLLPEVFLHSGIIGACLVTTDMILATSERENNKGFSL